MRSSLILAGLLVSGMSGSLAAAPIYKWVDAQGMTHYGSQPPQDNAVQKLPNAVLPPSARSVTAPAGKPEAGKPDAAQKAIDAKVQAEVEKTEKERQDYCVKVRTSATQLRNNPRLQVEENGQTRRLSEEERQKKLDDADKAIRETCQ